MKNAAIQQESSDEDSDEDSNSSANSSDNSESDSSYDSDASEVKFKSMLDENVPELEPPVPYLNAAAEDIQVF